jgi:Skp family chaperone for outer membrane proteins
MKTQPYQLVINNDTAVIWSAPELDMTNAVIGRMNAQ